LPGIRPHTYDSEFHWHTRPGTLAHTSNTNKPGTVTNVALIGFGTVGRSVAKILCAGAHPSLRLTHIFNRNVQKKKQDWIPTDVVWTEDLESVFQSGADIIIELIGGLNPAEQIVRRALEAGKSVVTANKQLIARCGPDLMQLAARKGSHLEFGASVA